jgi:hypothetical protein
VRELFLFLLVFGAAYSVLDFSGKAPAPPLNVGMVGSPKSGPATQSAAPTTARTISQSVAAPDDRLMKRRLLKVWTNITIDAETDRAEFDARMKMLNLDRLLDANVLMNPENYDRAREDLLEAQRLIDAREKFVNTEVEQIPDRCASAGIPENYWRPMLDRMQDYKETQSGYFLFAMALERDRIIALTDLLDFVEPRLLHMHAQHGALVCDDPADDALLLKKLRALQSNRQQQVKLESGIFAAAEEFRKNPLEQFHL